MARVEISEASLDRLIKALERLHADAKKSQERLDTFIAGLEAMKALAKAKPAQGVENQAV